MDVLAAQVRAYLGSGMISLNGEKTRLGEAVDALDSLVGYAKRAEELQRTLELIASPRYIGERDATKALAREALGG